MKIQLERLKN